MKIKILNDNQVQVTLEMEIKRGDSVTHDVILNKPTAGMMGNSSQIEIMQQNYRALGGVISKFTEPAIQQREWANMDLTDTSLIGMAVQLFFMTGKARLKMMETLAELSDEVD